MTFARSDKISAATTTSQGFVRGLRTFVDELTPGGGFQVAIWERGSLVVSEAYGVDSLGRQLNVDSLHSIYCAGKPLTALAIGVLVEAGEVSFHDRIGDIVDGCHNVPIGGVTVEALLSHRCGLHRFQSPGFLSMGKEARRHAVRGLIPEEPSRAGNSTYAEFAGWALLEQVVEKLAEQPIDLFIRNNILCPLGIDSDVILSDSQVGEYRDRLRVNASHCPARRTPLLWEQAETSLADVCTASGIRASMVGLGRVYVELLNVLTKRTELAVGVVGLNVGRALTSAATALGYDSVLERTCSQARGFFVSLANHGFDGRHSVRSFGHCGLAGMTFAAADPDLDLVYSVHLNTMLEDSSGDGEVAPGLARRLAVSSMVLDLFGGQTGSIVGAPLVGRAHEWE